MLHSVMWVCLCIPGHIHCSCSTVMALLCIPLSELVSFAFSTIPICPFLIPRIFHLLVSTLFLLQIACEYFLWSGENTICRPIYVHSILTKCVPLFATVLTAVQSVECSHMYSCLGSGNCINTVIDVRDSVAPRSYVDSRSQAFSDSWAWARLEAT